VLLLRAEPVVILDRDLPHAAVRSEGHAERRQAPEELQGDASDAPRPAKRGSDARQVDDLRPRTGSAIALNSGRTSASSVKMDDPNVYVEAMTTAGLDGAALLERTQDPTVKAKLAENSAAAVARGAFGIPRFYVGSEMFFGKERLGQLAEEIVAASTR
jgi:hypothetical protein